MKYSLLCESHQLTELYSFWDSNKNTLVFWKVLELNEGEC